jgi:hypothetical protein
MKGSGNPIKSIEIAIAPVEIRGFETSDDPQKGHRFS